MNGNHTVSPRQVEAIMNAAEGILSSAKAQIEEKINDFLKESSKLWADDEAVKMSNRLYDAFGEVISGLGGSGSKLSDEVVDIANKYAKAGGKLISFNRRIMKFGNGITKGLVKASFDDDSFGIKDENSLSNVEALFDNNLVPAVQKVLDDLVVKLSRTNAFGNGAIIAALAGAGVGIREGAIAKLQAAKRNVHEEVEQARKKYQSVSSSVGGSNFIGGMN